MSFKLYKSDPFLQRNEDKLKSFKETVPLSSHTFELKDEPEETLHACYVLFNRYTKEINSVHINRVAAANRNSHYAIYDNFDHEIAQWAKTHISRSESKLLQTHLYKLKTIDQLENWRNGICECETCGSCE